MGRRSGFLVKHEDGRTGVVYHSDQRDEFKKIKKVLVVWEIGNQTLVSIEKIKRTIGFVD